MTGVDERTITGHNIEYQRREWVAQRIGWTLMGLVVLAAFVGLLGSGPLARTDASSGDGALSIEYYRVARHHQPRTLSVTVAPGSVQNGEVQVWLDRAYADKFGLESIVPDPDSTDVEPDRVVYTFTTGQGDGPLTVTFFYNHDGFWRQRARVGLVDGPSLGFSQFMLP
jgi:hypothetical protein